MSVLKIKIKRACVCSGFSESHMCDVWSENKKDTTFLHGSYKPTGVPFPHQKASVTCLDLWWP
ncbi:unnamed protein product, partial [Allacma fusca]